MRKTTSEKEPNNASDIQSTYNGTAKLITSNSTGIAGNTVAAIRAIGGFAGAAVSLPAGVLAGAVLTVSKAVLIMSEQSDNKSIEKPNTGTKNTQTKP